MIRQSGETLADLYEADETAWLDVTGELIGAGRFSDLDYLHLKEYLEDMAKRDRREVSSRLKVLLVHVLKWTYQKEIRTPSWRVTIGNQREELDDNLLTSRTLRNHAESILAQSCARAVEDAVDETGLPAATFPPDCPWTLDQLLSPEVLES